MSNKQPIKTTKNASVPKTLPKPAAKAVRPALAQNSGMKTSPIVPTTPQVKHLQVAASSALGDTTHPRIKAPAAGRSKARKDVADAIKELETEGREIHAGVRDGRFKVHMEGDMLICEGSERIGTFQGIATTNVPVQAVPLNPNAFGVRCPLTAKQHTKFRYRKLTLVYVPMLSPASANASGSVVMTYNPDPVVQYPLPSDAGLNEVYAWDNVRIFQVCGDNLGVTRLETNLTSDVNDWFYCDEIGDQRLYLQGNLYWATGSPLSSSTTYGQCYVEYEIAFADPIIDNQPLFTVEAVSPMNISMGAVNNLSNASGASNSSLTFASSTLQPAGSIGSGILNISNINTTAIPGWLGDVDFLAVKDSSFGVNTLLMLAPGAYLLDVSYLACAGATITVTAGRNPPPIYVTAGTMNIVNMVSTLDGQLVAPNPVFATYVMNSFTGMHLDSYTVSLRCFGPSNMSVRIGTPAWTTTGAVPVGYAVHLKLTQIAPEAQGGTPAPINASGAVFARGELMAKVLEFRDREYENEVKALIESTTSHGTAVDCAVRSVFGDKNVTMPTILPAIAAAVSWFVATYGPSLAKGALDWAVHKLEEKLR